ncbi:MAG: hypothetical protein JWO82_4232, partial [Akkermansiaceae bacterium]|nr:hypothetical protein [Akkermansiaceae bacterium]
MPLTRAILDLPEGQRDKILAEILR